MATDIIARGLAGTGLAAANLANQRLDALPKGVVYRGVVDYYDDLPQNPELGDMYTVRYLGSSGTTPSGAEYVWTEDNGVETWVQVTFSLDDALSSTSENPVQNKVIYDALLGKVDVLTVAPTANNDAGRLGIVILQSQPANMYEGYIYIIDSAEVVGHMLNMGQTDRVEGTTLIIESDHDLVGHTLNL